MNAIERLPDSTTTSTPISDAMVSRLRVAALPIPELSDLDEPIWLNYVARQIEAVSALEEGWDGHLAGPIRRDVISYAIRVLTQIMQPRTPPPQIAPMSHEGLMLDWRENGIELEIEIEKPGHLWMSFEDANVGEEDEGPLSGDLRKLAMLIKRLMPAPSAER